MPELGTSGSAGGPGWATAQVYPPKGQFRRRFGDRIVEGVLQRHAERRAQAFSGIHKVRQAVGYCSTTPGGAGPRPAAALMRPIRAGISRSSNASPTACCGVSARPAVQAVAQSSGDS